MIGVYTWSNGTKARITFKNDKLIFDDRLIFPENDFRMEYRGACKNGNVMHGRGTLTLENGKSFTVSRSCFWLEWCNNLPIR